MTQQQQNASPEKPQQEPKEDLKAKKAEQAKAKQEAKAKARLEAEEKERAEAERVAAERAAQEQAELELSQATANQVASCGKLGQELVDFAKSLENVPVRQTLLAVFKDMGDSVASGEWCKEDQLGALCKHLCAGKSRVKKQKQAQIIYAVQETFDVLRFPRTDDGESKLQRLFYAMYNEDVVEEDGFQEWRYAEEDEDIPGKLEALTQCNEFLLFLDQPDEDDEDDE